VLETEPHKTDTEMADCIMGKKQYFQNVKLMRVENVNVFFLLSIRNNLEERHFEGQFQVAK
jgi:hypothetical protein